MKKVSITVILAAMMVIPARASAYDRYARGRTLYFRRCGPCFSMGWKWSPQKVTKPLDLKKMARTWTPAQVCTWMRKNTKKLVPPGCYPGKISAREKLDILYYVKRKTEGPIRKPLLKAVFRRLRHKVRLKRLTRARRESALRAYRNLKETRRLRRQRSNRKGRWSGSLRPASDAVAHPRTGRSAR